MSMGGKEAFFSQSPTPEGGNQRNGGDCKFDTQLASPALNDGSPGAQPVHGHPITVHGHPITISQCTFQAHIAR